MACGGCPNNNFSSNRPPTGADDPCNTSGEGIFCPGSYWLYDPTLAGADTATHGDCPRLYQRIGDTCGVDDWLEIPIQQTIRSTVDPTIADCCPAGTLWENTVTDSLFISYSDLSVNPPTCGWCEICNQYDLLALSNGAVLPLEAIPLPVAPGTNQQLLDTSPTVAVTNTGDQDMVCIINIWSSQIAAVSNDLVNPTDIGTTTEWTFDGGGAWQTSTAQDISIILGPAGTGLGVEQKEIGTAPYHTSRIIAPGATETYGFRRLYSSISGFDGALSLDTQVLTVTCIGMDKL